MKEVFPLDNNFSDQNLTCVECNRSFVWTAAEQKFYADKGLTNPPKRCPECRMKKRQQEYGDRRGGGGGRFGNDRPRQMFDAVCSNCGKPCQVPFQPTMDETGKPVKPIFCKECYAKTKQR